MLFHLINDTLFQIGVFPYLAFAARPSAATGSADRARRWRRVAIGLAAVWLAVQLLVPLRHLLYPGVSNWTEHGHILAWHMKLRSKMTIRPEMIREFAHHLAEQFAADGRTGVQVYATGTASLNGRPPQPLVDPRVDLAAQPRSLLPAPWIVPLRHDLPAVKIAPRGT